MRWHPKNALSISFTTSLYLVESRYIPAITHDTASCVSAASWEYFRAPSMCEALLAVTETLMLPG